MGGIVQLRTNDPGHRSWERIGIAPFHLTKYVLCRVVPVFGDMVEAKVKCR
jgi:hypothetical protein